MSPQVKSDPLFDAQKLVPRVYGYVAYRIGHGPEAEDVTSEAFVRALRYRDSYDPRKGSAISWLIGIAARCIADAARPREPVLPAERDVVDGVAEWIVERLDLRAAVGRLGERDRELIALRYGADLTASQIAAALGLKTNAVEVALHRALNRLRDYVEPALETSSAPRNAASPVRV